MFSPKRIRQFVVSVRAMRRTLQARVRVLEESLAESKAILQRMHLKSVEREVRLSQVATLQARITELERQSERDPLTQIYNERGFIVRLEKFLRQLRDYETHQHKRREHEQGRPVGIFVLLDLNLFKCVNDVISQEKGDRLLRMIATYLIDRVGRHPGDFVGRLHGDEFLMFFRNSEDPAEIRAVLDNEVRPKIRSLVPPGVDIANYKNLLKVDYLVDASYGMVVVNSAQLSFDTLLSVAGEELRTMKRQLPDARELLRRIQL